MNLPNLPEWFQYNFFFIFWGTDRGVVGFPSSLVVFFQFRYPLDMYLILSVVLIYRKYLPNLFQYRVSFKEKKKKKKEKKEKKISGRVKEDNNGNYIPNSFSFFDKKKNKNTSLARRRFERRLRYE